MKSTHEFNFAVGERVSINALQREGVVTGLLINRGNTGEVRVAYWWDGRREEEWMYPDEISSNDAGETKKG